MVVSPSEISVPAQQSRVSDFSGMGLVHLYMLWKYLEIIVVLELINPGNVTSLLLGLGWETVWSWANMARSEERSAVLYSQPGKMEQPVCCSRLHYTEQDFTPAGWNSGERGPEVCEQEGRDRGNLHRFIYNIYLAYKNIFPVVFLKFHQRIGLEVESQLRLGPGLGWLEEDWTRKSAVVPESFCFDFLLKNCLFLKKG